MTTPLAFSLLPERASDVARSVDACFYALLLICGVITAGVFGALAFFCVRYQRGSPVARSPQATALSWEIAWTGLTLLIFLAIFVAAAFVYVRMSQPPENALEIHVIGKQWMWKAQHPSGRREINELHLLLGQPVKLVMTSQDVIHDFSIPAFRTKQDVVPGRYTTEWFTPTKPGSYHLYCSEYCGMDHSRMGGFIHVLEPREHAQWLSSAPEAENIIITGARLFQARGCSGCHAQGSVVHAPLLDGVYNRPVALSDGSIVVANEQYLHDSILQPAKQITAGYENLMPSYQGQLGEEEVMQLVAYLKSLGSTPR